MLMNASSARKDIRSETKLCVCSPSRSGGVARAHRAAASAWSRAKANIICSRWARSHTCSPASPPPPGEDAACGAVCGGACDAVCGATRGAVCGVGGAGNPPGGPPTGAGAEGSGVERRRRRRRGMVIEFGGTEGDPAEMRRKELRTMRELTPMMRQYRSLKDQHPHAILLFRLGDFFEAFFEDAQAVAQELQLTLTSRPVAKGRRIPMCGIPHHALHTYLRRLIDRGHRVAICDQVEDPRHAGALVRREVVRVVTPGTVVEDDLLSARENNFLAAVASSRDGWGAAFADLSTGEFFATQGDIPDHLHAALALWHPRELLVPDDPGAGVVMEDVTATAYDAERFEPPVAARALREHLGVATLDAFGLAEAPLATAAAGALVQYLRETQRGSLPHLRAIRFNPRSSGMVIDEATERALGLWSRGATLLSVLDLTETPMGARLLRRWLQQPLLDPAQITARLDAVDAFVPDAAAREALRARLKSLGDVERWSGRLAQAAGTPRDLAALRASLEALPAVAPIV